MKFKKITYLFLVVSVFLCGNLHSQSNPSVNITNMQYINGTPIASGGTIEIENGSNARIQFVVNVSNPPATQGYLTVYTTRNTGDSPTQHGGSETIYSGQTSYNSSKDITLEGNQFFATGGKLYAEFTDVAGFSYKSNSYSISVSGGSGGGGGNTPPITFNKLDAGQVVNAGQNAEVIFGTLPEGGNGQYTYQWYKKEVLSWNSIPDAHSKNYQPITPNVTTYYKRKVISGSTFSFSNEHVIIIPGDIQENIIISDKTVIESGEIVELTGNVLQGPFRQANWKTYYNRQAGFSSVSLNEATTTPLTKNTIIRRNIQTWGGDGGWIFSNEIFVRVILGKNQITYNNQLCKIEGSIPEGEFGVESYTYQWYQRPVNGNWSSISGASAKDYTPPTCSPVSTIQYKRIVYSANIYPKNTEGKFIQGEKASAPSGYSSNFVEILGSNGIIKDKQNAIIFPNPSKEGYLNVNLKGKENIGTFADVILYNFSGYKIFEQKMKIDDNFLIRNINLEAFEKGIYLLKIISDNGIYTEQLIIE
ncbi:MAG: T9SS type A sorting domain-containing protein [Aequorivita sp.]|nr:T9SS type A sorting domain-containing protein [Aequorivita sp.]